MATHMTNYVCKVSLKSFHSRDIASRGIVINGQRTDGQPGTRFSPRTIVSGGIQTVSYRPIAVAIRYEFLAQDTADHVVIHGTLIPD